MIRIPNTKEKMSSDLEFSNQDNLQSVSLEQFRQLERKFNRLLEKQTSKNLNPKRVIIEKDPPQNEGLNLKPTKLPEFLGIRSEYPAWRAAVLDTFRMDWLLFGYDNSRAFLMIYKSLKGSARTKAGPFYENGGVHQTRDPEDFIEFLDRIYLDSTRVSRANTELHLMKMKENQRWSDFLASWSNKLTEARGDFWPDDNKISLLQSALNKKLTIALAGNHMLPEDDFNDWVEIVNKIAQRLEMVDIRFGNWQNLNSPEAHKDRKTLRNNTDVHTFESRTIDSQENIHNQRLQAGDLDDSGDTIMGGINAANIASSERRRAKWKTRADIERLKKEGRCFRCERQGCITSRCPLLPAKKPKNLRVNVVTLPEIDPSLYIIDEENRDSEN